MGDGGVAVVESGLMCACSEALSSAVAAADAVTEMAEEEESPDGDCDEDETTWPRLKEGCRLYNPTDLINSCPCDFISGVVYPISSSTGGL